MNFCFVVRDRRGELVNVPVDKADARDKEEAVAVRVTCAPSEKARAKELLLKTKALGFEGDLKEGTSKWGTLWMTLGRRGAPKDNTSAFDALFG